MPLPTFVPPTSINKEPTKINGHPTDPNASNRQILKCRIDRGAYLPLGGSDVTKRLMCSGPFRRENSRLLVKAEWDVAEVWLRLVPDERKRKELGLQTIEEVGNY